MRNVGLATRIAHGESQLKEAEEADAYSQSHVRGIVTTRC
jgi:hypothetical protein